MIGIINQANNRLHNKPTAIHQKRTLPTGEQLLLVGLWTLAG